MALTSVCAQEEGQSRAGTLAPERGRGDRQGVLLLAERARGSGGRGWRAGHGAARLLCSACPRARVSTAVSRRVQPSSPAARAAAGGLSQHLPAVSHTPFRDTGGFARTRARLPPHAPFGVKKKSKFKTKSCGDERARLTKVRRLGSLLAAAGRGGRGRARGSEAKSLSLSREARSARAEPAGPASGARAAPAAWGTTLPPALPHTSGPLAWGLGGLCGRRRRGTRVQGKRREEQGRAAPMHSRGGRLVPSTIAKNPPVSSRWRSGTSACVCL